MRRRTVLAALASVALPASGCVELPVSNGGDRTDGTDTPTGSTTTATRDPTSTPTPTESTDVLHEVGEFVRIEGHGPVTVESMAVQEAAFLYNGTFYSLYEPDGERQFLVVTVDADSPPDFPLAVRLDGERLQPEPPEMVDGFRYDLPVPLRSVSSAAVVAEAGDRPAWRVPRRERERLGAAPEFRVLEAGVEDTSPPSLSITVENRGGRDGVFRGMTAIEGYADEETPFRFPVERGETVTESVTNDGTRGWDPDAELTHTPAPDTRVFEGEREDL